MTKTELTTILRWVGQETFARSGTRTLILTAPWALSFKLGQVKQHVFVQLTEPCRRNEKTQKTRRLVTKTELTTILRWVGQETFARSGTRILILTAPWALSFKLGQVKQHVFVQLTEPCRRNEKTQKKRRLVTKTELTTILRWVGQETFARSGTRILILTVLWALSFKLGQVKQHVFVQLTEPCRRNEKTQKTRRLVTKTELTTILRWVGQETFARSGTRTLILTAPWALSFKLGQVKQHVFVQLTEPCRRNEKTQKTRRLVTKTELTTILRWVGQETFARSGTRTLILTAPWALSFKLGQVKQHVFVQLTEPCRRNEKTQKKRRLVTKTELTTILRWVGQETFARSGTRILILTVLWALSALSFKLGQVKSSQGTLTACRGCGLLLQQAVTH